MEVDERRRRDRWRDGPTENSLREHEAEMKTPESSELGVQDSRNQPVDCKSSRPQRTTGLKFLTILGTLQQAQVLVNRVVF